MVLRFKELVENHEIYVVGPWGHVLSWNSDDIFSVPLLCLLCSLHIMYMFSWLDSLGPELIHSVII